MHAKLLYKDKIAMSRTFSNFSRIFHFYSSFSATVPEILYVKMFSLRYPLETHRPIFLSHSQYNAAFPSPEQSLSA